MSRSGSAQRVERQVLGADVGASSYTSVAQADALIAQLGLRTGMHVLDIGAGRGWPGIHVAAVSACSVQLTDLSLGALQEAQTRARREGVAHLCTYAVASGAALPFRPKMFDVILHTDVL